MSTIQLQGLTFLFSSVIIPFVFFERRDKIKVVIIKWTNKFSHESGFVASLSTKNECFINTFEQENARRYSEKSVSGIMKKLEAYHETDNNDFEYIAV